MSFSPHPFTQIVETLPEAVVVTGQKLHVVYMNRAAREIFGVATVDGDKTLLEFIAPIHRQMFSDATARLLAAEESSAAKWLTVQIRTGDGRVLGAQATLSLVAADEQQLLCSTWRIPAQDPRLELLACAPDVLLLVGSDGRIDYANNRVSETFGYQPGELIGESIEILIPERFGASHVRLRDKYQKQPTARPMGIARHLTARRKDGSEFSAEVGLAPVRLSERTMTGVVVRDVTQKRLLDIRMNTVHRVEAIGRLAGGIAHDLNNILTAILGFADSAKDEVSNNPAMTDVVSDMQEVIYAAERAKQLIQNLLAFSRRRPVDPVIVDVNLAILGLSPMLHRLLGKAIEYTTQLANDLWHVRIDPGAIEQVLVNLGVNARDAMNGKGRLVVATSNVNVNSGDALAETNTPPGDYVQIAVSDNGHGMDAETLKHIFEPFYSTKGPSEGTGLGLSTCYGLVTQAQGFIWVQSEVGRGTTFNVYLPRAPGGSPHLASTLPPEHMRGNNTILVTEDDPQVLSVTSRALRKFGYHVLEASGWEQALGLCEQHPNEIALLLTDVVMPGLNGRLLADKVTARWPHTKVLFMSGYTDNVIIQPGVFDRSVDFISKPFTPEFLAQRVSQLLYASEFG